MNKRILNVYWDANLVGKLIQNQSGALSFAYDRDFLQNASTGISISLPLQTEEFEGDAVKAFFSGLLPEESIRLKLAGYLGVSDKNTFALLKAVGGECAGALALYPEGEKPTIPGPVDAEILDEARLIEILEFIKRRPLLSEDNRYRLSLAGAQDKLAVGFEKGQVILIKGGSPTTHILKPPIDHITDSAHNELFCMRLAKMIGLDVPFSNIYFAKSTPYYLVERYDRFKKEDGTVIRIHQEDFCQALGILPEIKYEREGGPSLFECQEIISSHAAHPSVDQLKLLNRVIFNYLIGNADAHGKNFSLLYRGAKPELSPAYDLFSTAIYPNLSEKMAMKIGGKYNPNDVFLRHWHKLVPETKAAQSMLHKQLKAISIKTTELALSLKQTLETQGIRSLVFTSICKVIEARAKKIQERLIT